MQIIQWNPDIYYSTFPITTFTFFNSLPPPIKIPSFGTNSKISIGSFSKLIYEP